MIIVNKNNMIVKINIDLTLPVLKTVYWCVKLSMSMSRCLQMCAMTSADYDDVYFS